MQGRGKEGKGRWRNRLANGLILLALGLYWVPGIWGDAAPARADGPSTQSQASAQSPAAEPSLTNPEPARAGGTGEAWDLLEKLEETRQENPDTVGWLWVPGAGVDQPVMQTPGDNEYYLRRGLSGEYDSRGCLFLDERCDALGQTVNRLVYGHEMKDGSMFGQLKNYRDPACFERWPLLAYATGAGVEVFRVMAVIEARVLNQGEEGFRYYYFFDAATSGEWEEWYKNIRQMALYDTGVTGHWGDRYLTLSTCDSSRPGGRLALVARREEWIPAEKLLGDG